MSNCFYHDTAPASGTCVQCGLPICAACTTSVGVKTACPSCLPAVKARVEQAQPVAAGAAPSPQTWSPDPPQIYQPGAPAVEAPSYKSGVDSSFVGQTAAGLGLGLVLGIICSIIVFKLLFFAHFGLSYLYVVIGYGVGFGIHKVTGRGGTALGIMGVLVMVVSLFAGHLSYAADVLNAARAEDASIPASLTAFDVFRETLGSFGFMHWVCVAIGLGACYRAIEAQDAA
ncbi:MAG TPA: B-box zinc finger protein [Capsulimonadaceae bacterium]|jgi:hypothetical protein